MKNKLFAMACSTAMALFGIAGYATMVKADNDRYEYSFYNGNSQGNSGKEEKATNREGRKGHEQESVYSSYFRTGT